ncbi:MAG: hypothetical protein RJA78_593 [Actinomycetota bacterium]
MKKLHIVLGSIALVTVGAYLFSTSEAKPIAPALRLGVLVSDSGPLYFAGEYQRAATKLAIADLAKASDPVKVTVSFLDLGDSATEFDNARQKLDDFRADVLLAPIESSAAVRLLKTTGDQPVLATSAIAEKIENQLPVFRLAPTQSQEVIALAQYIVDSEAKSVAIVFSDDEYGKTTLRSLAMAFALRGMGKIQVVPLSEYSRVIRTKPDALVLATLEQSISFFAEYAKFQNKPKQLYLVPGNLASYSTYPWANQVKGVLGLLSQTDVPDSFRNRLANVMKRPAVKTTTNPIVTLAFLTYRAVMISGESFVKAGSNFTPRLRTALLESASNGVRNFTSQGIAYRDKYSVYQYSAKGSYSVIGEYEPKQ